MRKPFLLEFARKCCSPGRESKQGNFYYDETSDIVRWLGAETHPAAIDLTGEEGPRTKKHDIEKSEDSKDRRMWQ